MNIKGIDVSYCQRGLDYDKVKAAGVQFAIIRAGARYYEDSLLGYHISGCKSIGIDYGFYWYCYAHSVEDAEKEALKCLEVIGKYGKPKYPVFFDMEENSQANLGRKLCTDMALKFCETIEKGGYPAGIYANPAWLESFYYKAQLVGKYDIWLAHWTESPNRPSSYNYGQTMHQWGLDKIGMKIDGDICYIDYPAKTAEWYAAHGNSDETVIEDNKIPLAPAPDIPDKAGLRKGDKVYLRDASLYGSSDIKKKAAVVNGTYWIHSDGVYNGRIRITTPKDCSVCTGWVDIADCKVIEFHVGDAVRVKEGAKCYNGEGLARFVYSQKYTVMQVGTRGRPDYIVIGQGGVVTAALHSEDLYHAED